MLQTFLILDRFLWVEFQLEDLSEQETDHGIKAVLQHLPRSLSETYDRLFAKIEGAERRQYIERILRWLIAARQPLHVDELLEGIAFTLEDTSWDREKIPNDFKRLVRACSNLVVVDPDTQIVHLGMSSSLHEFFCAIFPEFLGSRVMFGVPGSARGEEALPYLASAIQLRASGRLFGISQLMIHSTLYSSTVYSSKSRKQLSIQHARSP